MLTPDQRDTYELLHAEMIRLSKLPETEENFELFSAALYELQDFEDLHGIYPGNH